MRLVSLPPSFAGVVLAKSCDNLVESSLLIIPCILSIIVNITINMNVFIIIIIIIISIIIIIIILINIIIIIIITQSKNTVRTRAFFSI